MSDIFDLTTSDSPLVISVPHDGALIPETIQKNMHGYALDTPDRDTGISSVFEFENLKYSKIKANYSRYVVDLNRPAAGGALYAGQNETTVCPTTLFDERPIYLSGHEPSAEEVAHRVETYWRPYHVRLQALIDKAKAKFGFCLLIDAHSIDAVVPRFFEGRLSDISVGTYDGKSCSDSIQNTLIHHLSRQSNYSYVINDRFKGGYITRQYGQPQDGIHAVQLEHAKSVYGDNKRHELTAFWLNGLNKLLEMFEIK
ncbi:N-formylglutamate amidohydrolase [Marinicella rhabdoformis]|uniref:N-formylglutamate amidohydrolase n=1 Tax=Marinicella rhabdoformis TaxID=2580566 RepID=UPI0015D03BA1|nr:N-formylglutamate amidohydrolase [Marinicella rhabdoformis]